MNNVFTVDQFLELENRIWKALKTGNAEADSKMLSEEFLGVYDDGFSGKNDHVGQLVEGAIISCYELNDARIKVLSERVVLLSYFAEFKRLKNQSKCEVERMYVSSIWSNETGSWENIFSQDTPTNS